MERKIINILSRVRPEFDLINCKDFIGQGILDSFDVISLVSELDQEFEISIDGVDIIPENFVNLNTIMELLIKNGATYEP